jgi:beta-lactamase class A
MRRRVLFSVVVLFFVFAGGVFAGRASEEITPVQTIQKLIQKMDVSESDVSYKFINPLLFCNDQTLSNGGASAMEDGVAAYIAQEKNIGDLIDASFYFRDLNGGPWAGVNLDFQTLPASLLKVPLAISAYQHAEKNPSFLNTEIIFKGGANTDQSEHFQPPEKLRPGIAYKVGGLVRYMLADSDNSAMYLLGSMLDPQELADSYMRLGIDPPIQAGYTIGVKTYASFFRVLYNATYLNQDNSEQLLSLLSQSTFTQGIVAGVPPGTVVAHKFGESNPGDGTVRLNDCGIVYKPNQPYVLCVMTKGANFDTLANVISRISKTVYQILQSQN